MKFSDIPGNDDVKERLKHLADSGKIPHAILLEGPSGTGKFALARTFLQYVDCTNRRNGEPCGECPSCRQHQVMQHVDTVYSYPYVKKKNSTKDSPTYAADYLTEFIELVKENPFMDDIAWLELLGSPNTKPLIYVEEANSLIRRLSFAPHTSKYNSVVVWQAHRLNEAASNKLLKVIEEPPGNAIIILTSDSPREILPTIYSRVQRLKVKPVSDDKVAQWLYDNADIDAETAADIAPLAKGSITEALRIASRRDDSQRFLEYFIQLMRLAYKRDIAALKEWSNKLAAEKRDTIVDFLEYSARMLRENFVANLHRPDLNLMTSAESDFSRNFARFINENNAIYLFDTFSEAITDIRGNVNPKIVLFDLAITVILKLKQ